jgi:hypothetical protein
MFSDAEFEQLALQQQPCSIVWIRCLNNLANVYNGGEHDDISNYITVLQAAALEPYGASYRRYTHI